MSKISKRTWIALVSAIVISCAVAVKKSETSRSLQAEKLSLTTFGNDSGNPFPISSPAYREAKEFRDWLIQNRKLEAASGGASETERIRLSGQLGTEGMARLPTDILERHMPIMAKLLGSFDDASCSEILRGKMTMADFRPRFFSAIGSLNETDAKEWFSVTRLAIEAQLDNRPIIELARDSAQQAILRIALSLSDEQSTLFLARLAAIRTESNADVCSVGRTIFSQAALLPEPYRGYIARLFLSGNQSSKSL